MQTFCLTILTIPRFFFISVIRIVDNKDTCPAGYMPEMCKCEGITYCGGARFDGPNTCVAKVAKVWDIIICSRLANCLYCFLINSFKHVVSVPTEYIHS